MMARYAAWVFCCGVAFAACDTPTVGSPGEDAAPDAAVDVPVGGEDAAGDEGIGGPGDGGTETSADADAQTGPGLGIDYGSTEPGAAPRYEPGSDDWTAVGWPSDRFRGPDGGLDLSRFPDQDIDLLQDYLAHGEEALDGFGLNGAVYFQLDGAPDPASLPTPETSTESLSVVQLVDVTAGSPGYGDRRPLRFRWYGGGGDDYYLPGTLAMRPVFGHPLTEGQTWCALVTRGVKDVEGRYLQAAPAFVEALDEDPSLAPLADWLADSPLHREDLAVATCFTTQRATGELRAVTSFLDGEPAPEVELLAQPTVAAEFHGTYRAPNFQAGHKPYEAEGGDIRFDAGGQPIVQEMEPMRFLLMVPREGEVPEAGWPVVLYAHGTGGDYESCRGVSEDLRERGFAVLCIDQPLHGSRGAGLDLGPQDLVLFNFNFVNPRSGRSSFRQAAIDTLSLTRMVAAGRFTAPAAETLSGRPLRLDPGEIHFFGHSHGGLSGALVLGVDPLVDSAILSGAGGVMIETLLRRKDPLDIAGLVGGLLRIAKEDLDTFHPLLSVIQMLVDATDPINYAPYWLRPAEGGAPKHVLVTEGTADHATPSVATDAMAAAAGVPQVGNVARHSVPHRLWGLARHDLPARDNVDAGAGVRTAGLAQWQDESHWVAFNHPGARSSWRTFFDTLARTGTPTIGRGPDAPAATLPVAPGETCADAPVVSGDDLPARVSGDTSLARDDYAPGGCGWDEAPQRDQVIAFEPTVSGRYRFTSSRPGEEQPGPNRMYVTTDCAAPAQGCVGSSGAADLDAGETYYVIVDGASGPNRGAFDVNIEQTCAVDACGDRECGDLGCGSCGTCADGESCTAGGRCEPHIAGDTCQDAREIDALPFVDSGDTRRATNGHGYGPGQCPGETHGYGAGSNDVIYRFTAPAADRYDFRLDATYDANLYVVADCADVAGSCLAADRLAAGREEVQVDLDTGEEVFVVVDGAFNHSNRAGWYTLRVSTCAPTCEGRACGSDGCGGSCGGCGEGERCVREDLCEPIPYICTTEASCEALEPGDLCADPFLVDALPFSHAGTTVGAHGDYHYTHGACPGESGGWGEGSADVVYSLLAEEAGRYRVSASADFDLNLYAASDCGDIDGSCIRASETPAQDGSDAETFYLDLAAGEEVFVFVDGYANDWNADGDYTLEIDTCAASCEERACGSDGCGGSCGSCGGLERCSKGACVPRVGLGCEAARAVGKLPWKHEGDTSGFDSLYTNTCGAEPVGGASKDVAYRFTAPEAGSYTVTLDAEFAARLAVVEDCDAFGGTCLADSAEEATLELQEEQTVFLVVDGAAQAPDAAAGSYTLRVEAACTPDCEGRICGSDGCGGSCGSCEPPADVCDPDGGCAAPEELAGNTCESAFVVPADGLPFAATETTEAALNHYGLGEGHCGATVAKGRGSAEQVWRFTPEEAGTYRVELFPQGFEAVLYAVTDCADIPGSCLGAMDGEGAERLDLDLTAGQAVFLLVDGSVNGDNVTGEYDFFVSRL